MHFIRPYGFLSKPIYVSDKGWYFYLAEWGVFYLWFLIVGLLSPRIVSSGALMGTELFLATLFPALMAICFLARVVCHQKLPPKQL